jgi:isorenieratene synthase
MAARNSAHIPGPQAGSEFLINRRRGWVPGRDRRAVRHPAAAGSLRTTSDGSAPHVVVVGGGIAGLAAAIGLAERGVQVTLVEREDQLGGRVRSWRLNDQKRTMSRGFHAFFRQYYNLRGLLRRTDPLLSSLQPVADYPLVLADGHEDSFARVPRTPPLNLISFVATSPSFSITDLRRVDLAAALELLDVSFPETFEAYDGQSAAAFLDRLRFPDAARHLALEVFARSFFARPEQFSAGELLAMFHSYFLGSSEGLLFDVPVDDYNSVLWSPLSNYLQSLGVEMLTGTTALSLSTGGSTSGSPVVVTLGSGAEFSADAIVLATDPAATRQLIAESDLGGSDQNWRARVAAIRNAPSFAVWRLWLNRPVRAERPAFLGTSGFGPLDNVSVLERFEAGARAWSQQFGGSVIEVHAYALPEPVAESELKKALRAELGRIYPETANANVVEEEWLLSADCPLIDTSPWRLRPGVSTPDPRLTLAGDGIRCDLPVALMERAATTGLQAANQLLARWSLRGHDLWTVPLHGRHRLIPALHRLVTHTPKQSRPI